MPESNETNNPGASASSWASDIDEFSFGVPAQFTLGAGQYAYYKLELPVGKTVSIKLESDAPGSANQLYTSYGWVPTRYAANYAAAGGNQANREIVFFTEKEGYYYFLVYSSYVPAGQTNTCRLTVTFPGFAIHSLSVNSGSNVGLVTTVIRGLELTPDVSVKLTNPDVNQAASKV